MFLKSRAKSRYVKIGAIITILFGITIFFTLGRLGGILFILIGLWILNPVMKDDAFAVSSKNRKLIGVILMMTGLVSLYIIKITIICIFVYCIGILIFNSSQGDDDNTKDKLSVTVAILILVVALSPIGTFLFIMFKSILYIPMSYMI